MLQRARDMSGPLQNGVFFSHHGSLFLFSKNARWHFLTQALKENLLEFSRMFKQ